MAGDDVPQKGKRVKAPASPADVDLRGLLDRQVALIEAGDLDGLMRQYHDDAILLRFDGAVQGREALRTFFTNYLSRGPKIRNVDAFIGAADTLAYEATLAFEGTEARVYGVFVIRDGLIWRQVAGVLSLGSP